MNAKIGNWYVKYQVNQGDWKSLNANNKRYWYADPMLFMHKGKTYLFTEAFDRFWQKGKLAVSVLESNGEFSIPNVIIDMPYHLSYPCVFHVENKVYMIPETSQNRTIELWECISENMDYWEQKTILLHDVNYVDSTVLCCGNKTYLFCYKEEKGNYETDIYLFSVDDLRINQVFTILHSDNSFRPAGNFFYDKTNTLLRPLQYNVHTYGEYMMVFQVDSLIPFSEHLIREIKCSELECIDGIRCGACKTHTLGYMENVVVVDVLVEQNDIIQKMLFLIRKLRNAYYKLKYSKIFDFKNRFKR